MTIVKPRTSTRTMRKIGSSGERRPARVYHFARKTCPRDRGGVYIVGSNVVTPRSWSCHEFRPLRPMSTRLRSRSRRRMPVHAHGGNPGLRRSGDARTRCRRRVAGRTGRRHHGTTGDDPHGVARAIAVIHWQRRCLDHPTASIAAEYFVAMVARRALDDRDHGGALGASTSSRYGAARL